MIRKHDTKNPIKKINNSKKYKPSNYTKSKGRIKAKIKKTLNTTKLYKNYQIKKY